VKPAAILLAGGASRRMGQPKALLPIGGQTFLGRLLDVYRPYADPVVTVLGHEAERLRAAFPPDVVFAVNPEPERGQLSSLQTGLAAVRLARDILFQPMDYPAVREATVALLAARAPGLAIPVYGGRRGHPVRITPAIARELLALPPDAQARDVIRAHYATAEFVPVDDPGTVTDIDTPEDYARWIV